jgi:hypothetical protein
LKSAQIGHQAAITAMILVMAHGRHASTSRKGGRHYCRGQQALSGHTTTSEGKGTRPPVHDLCHFELDSAMSALQRDRPPWL